MRWFKDRFWYNGGKLTAVLAAGLIFASALTVAAIVDGSEADKPPFDAIGGYLLPQPVLEDEVQVGGVVHVGPVVKCNMTDQPVAVMGEMHFRRVSDGGTVVPGFTGSGTFLPGCWGDSDDNPLRFYTNSLPLGVTPGVWIVEGSDMVVEGEKVDVEMYFSDQFKVVP